MIKPLFHQTLKEVKQLLDSHGVFFWLVSGTLLGFIREGDFIEHDTDIDIAISLDDYYKHDIVSIFNLFAAIITLSLVVFSISLIPNSRLNSLFNK